ncbi:MAG: polysaccharide deacetylase family protein [Lachnospiraceae bacterium]|nr:polysaccharide deacetylase family protein [Lachnospiraceae bacterium]
MTGLYIVMYHYVRPIADSKYPGIKGLELTLFEKQIQFFNDNFSVVTMEQVVDAACRGIELPENALLLTFDDGYIDHYQYVFPILQKYSMQGSFFVPSAVVKYGKVLDVNKIHFILACSKIEELMPKVMSMLNEYRDSGYNIESNKVLFDNLAVANRWDCKEVIFVKRLLQGYLEEDVRNEMVSRLFEDIVGESEKEFSEKLYLNKEQITEMKNAGMYFGLHGEEHYWLNKLPIEKMMKDIDNSMAFFDEILDKDNLVINYPYGGYNNAVLDYAKKIGCKLGLGVEPGVANVKIGNAYALPRFDTNDFPPKSDRYMEYSNDNKLN